MYWRCGFTLKLFIKSVVHVMHLTTTSKDLKNNMISYFKDITFNKHFYLFLLIRISIAILILLIVYRKYTCITINYFLINEQNILNHKALTGSMAL